jgi:Protein of unknown function (DUF3223)
MRQPIEIGSLCFATKSAAVKHFQNILYRHAIGVPIPEPDATELGWLLERHHEYKQKLGAGIDYFITENAVYGTRGFRIIRIDKSSTDFSYLKCIDGKAPTPLSEALRAMRAEVAGDILQKKRDWFGDHAAADGTVLCAISNMPISLDEAHADHAPPRSFGTLAIAFLEARGIDPAALVTPSTDNQYEPRIKDPELAEAWRAYHHQLAVIRVVAKSANLARAHQGRVREKDKQLRLV